MNQATPNIRFPLLLAGTLSLVGQLLYVAVTQVHTGGEANDHHHIFADYAESGLWTAVHVGQFVGIAVLLSGLLALAFAFESRAGVARWIARLGAAGALAALALYGVLQAVDGVALKQAVTAWATAPETEKAARFASAETIRWLEWGMRSYFDFALGLSLVLFGTALAGARLVARPIGWVMALSGAAYLAQAWVAGTEGFTSAQSLAIVLAWALSLVWMIGLVVAAIRMRRSGIVSPSGNEGRMVSV